MTWHRRGSYFNLFLKLLATLAGISSPQLGNKHSMKGDLSWSSLGGRIGKHGLGSSGQAWMGFEWANMDNPDKCE